jgi:hypothetical protein
MGGFRFTRDTKLKILFFPPKSGSLALRLVLSDNPSLATLHLTVAGSPPLRFRVEPQTIVNVPLFCRSPGLDPLSFAPEKWNELTLEFTGSLKFLHLQHIQLSRDGIPYYGPREF